LRREIFLEIDFYKVYVLKSHHFTNFEASIFEAIFSSILKVIVSV